MYISRLQYYYDFIISYQLIMKLNQSNKFELPRLKKCTIYFNNDNSMDLYELIFLEFYIGTRIFSDRFGKNSLDRNTSKLYKKLTIRGNQLYNLLDNIILDVKIIKVSYNLNFALFLLTQNSYIIVDTIDSNKSPIKILFIFSSKISSYNKLLISYFSYDFIN